MTARSVRFDFSEPRAIAELERLCGPNGLKTVSTQEVMILLDWTRDRLRAHNKNHPTRPPRKSPKPKIKPKGWNAYLLADVVSVLKEEQAYWRAEQERVKRRAETPIEKRRRHESELNAAARAWPRTFSAWMNAAQLHDEWPVIRRASGPIEDMLDGLGSLQPGDQVLWMTFEAVLHTLIAHRQAGSRSEFVHF